MPNTPLHKHHHQISCLTHCTTGQLNMRYHQTTYPSSPQLTYNITTEYNKTDRLTNYKNADWTQFTEDTDSAFAQNTTQHTHYHNQQFFLQTSYKHNIPKGKKHSNCRLLPEDIVCKITQRNNIRKANTWLQTTQPTSGGAVTADSSCCANCVELPRPPAMGARFTIFWACRPCGPAGTWSIQQSTTTHTKHIHNIQQQNSNYTHTHCKLFHQTIHKHCQARNTQGYSITLTTSQVQEAIKQSKNNNSQGPDKLNVRHLKHIGPLGLAFLTSMFKTVLNKNIIPHTWTTKTQTRAPHTGPYPSSQ